jgi:hypothetical protein
MTLKSLLEASLDYLCMLLNLYTCGVAPHMSPKDAEGLRKLIDTIYEMLDEE